MSVSPGDEHSRLVCTECGYIHYENPKIVAAVVAVTPDGERVLLARRGIPPRDGYWGIPAGFMELNESADAAAAREAREECHAILRPPSALIACYSLITAKQVQLVYRATLDNPNECKPGIESLETELFSWDSLPMDQLAFPTVKWALEYARNTLHIDNPPTQMRIKLPDGTFV